MTDYMTTDIELTAIADAIRSKTSGGGRTGYRDYIMGLDNAASVDSPDAIIHVIYPEGCICTCTDGTTTITAPNTSGEVNFGVEIGTWIVSVSNNGKIGNKEIIIEQRREIKEVEISILLSANFDGILNNTSWEDISTISQAGIGDNYWDIGDCKQIVLNGKIGDDLILNNYTTYIFILDFNHPINKTIADNNIIFGGFKTYLSGGVDICLCDSEYAGLNSSSGIYFNKNHKRAGGNAVLNSNYGGWKGCDFRYDILGAVQTAPSPYNAAKTTSTYGYDATTTAITSPKANTLMAALPSDFRSALHLWTRWVDNKGNNNNADVNVTACVDAGISLLTEFEIFGSRKYANQYEQNHQKQIKYYLLGNNKIKYQHNATSTAATWSESSPGYDNDTFCLVFQDGTIGWDTTARSYGLAPAFKV